MRGFTLHRIKSESISQCTWRLEIYVAELWWNWTLTSPSDLQNVLNYRETQHWIPWLKLISSLNILALRNSLTCTAFFWYLHVPGYEIHHVTTLVCMWCTLEFPARFKNMADNEGDENSVVQQTATVLFNGETPKSEFCYDENTLLSPGEVCMMRNHPKVASVLFSPSRTTRGGEGKLKPKSFSTSLYASPTRKTVGLLELLNLDGFLSQVTFHRSQVQVTAIVHPNETCFYWRCTLGLASFY